MLLRFPVALTSAPSAGPAPPPSRLPAPLHAPGCPAGGFCTAAPARNVTEQTPTPLGLGRPHWRTRCQAVAAEPAPQVPMLLDRAAATKFCCQPRTAADCMQHASAFCKKRHCDKEEGAHTGPIAAPNAPPPPPPPPPPMHCHVTGCDCLAGSTVSAAGSPIHPAWWWW